MDSHIHETLDEGSADLFINEIEKLTEIQNISTYDVIFENENFYVNQRRFMIDLKHEERNHIKCTSTELVCKELGHDPEKIRKALTLFEKTELDEWTKTDSLHIFVTVSSITHDQGYIKSLKREYRIGEPIDWNNRFIGYVIRVIGNGWFEYEHKI